MRTLCIACIALAISLVAPAQDMEGSHDHPAVTRYPGSVIQWYTSENHRAYKVPTGPATGYRLIGDCINTEGRLTRIYYALEGGKRTHGEVYRNYMKALREAGFEILASGLHEKNSRGPEVGTRNWQEIFFSANPWENDGAANNMLSGSSTAGGSGSIIAKKERADNTLYVAVSVYHFSNDNVSTLVDVLETGEAETGLIVADAAAIGKGIKEFGRVVLDGILFDTGKATLKAESAAALKEISAYLKAHPERQFYVVGHTDSEGTLEDNQTLSVNRAKAVVEALVKNYGIEPERLEGHGVGPLVPVFTNATEGGREQNRRVELVER
ncbi:MAG: OmpA family protein [Candidatus Hydrogenedentes bacterium]|nr:OmpA family protein [Candidatus Hydrogenedentota bacterium]